MTHVDLAAAFPYAPDVRYHPRRTATIKERFIAAIRVTESCWLFVTGNRADGYAAFGIAGTYQVAHRLAYVWHYGGVLPVFRADAPRSKQTTVDHICRVRNCVNPNHLRLMSLGDNSARFRKERGTCAKGHPWTDESTYKYPDGRRSCRICNAGPKRAYKKRNLQEVRRKAREYQQRKYWGTDARSP